MQGNSTNNREINILFSKRGEEKREDFRKFHSGISSLVVDWAGLEPAILSEYGPEPYAYANSATSPPMRLFCLGLPQGPFIHQNAGDFIQFAIAKDSFSAYNEKF